MRTKCKVCDCLKEVVSHGLCDTHRKRFDRHGHIEPTRPPDWGLKEKHPNYHAWKRILKEEGKVYIQSSWKDFWEFVKDVGDRPNKNFRIYRLDRTKGFDKSNMVWREVTPSRDRRQYAKTWRELNDRRVRNSRLKTQFGITLEQYEARLESQNNVCAICKSASDKIALAVDHCHSTGKIRGLLCANCNKILGHAKDNVVILREAINYLGCVSSMMYGGEGEASPRHF